MKTQAETELMKPQKRKGRSHQKPEEARKDCFLELHNLGGRDHRALPRFICAQLCVLLSQDLVMAFRSSRIPRASLVSWNTSTMWMASPQLWHPGAVYRVKNCVWQSCLQKLTLRVE